MSRKTSTVTAARVYSTFLDKLSHRPLLSVNAMLCASPRSKSATIGKAICGTSSLKRLSAMTLIDQSTSNIAIRHSKTNNDHGSTAPCARAVNTNTIRNPTAIVLLKWSVAFSARCALISLTHSTQNRPAR